jgi:hypothetical protein
MDIDNCVDIDEYLEVDGEIICYLDKSDISRIIMGYSAHQRIRFSDGVISVSVHDNFGVPEGESGNKYDDVMYALEEVHSLLFRLKREAHTDEKIEGLLERYDYEKVMNTYEYFDNIRKEYE